MTKSVALRPTKTQIGVPRHRPWHGSWASRFSKATKARTPHAAIRKRICRPLIHPILSKEKTCRRRTNKKPPQKQKSVTTWCVSEKKSPAPHPPHFSANASPPLPPPAALAIAHACTQIRHMQARSRTQPGYARLALRALDVHITRPEIAPCS